MTRLRRIVARLLSPDTHVSRAWLEGQRRLEVRAVATVEHQLVIDGVVLLQHRDEATVRRVRTEIAACLPLEAETHDAAVEVQLREMADGQGVQGLPRQAAGGEG